MPIHRDILFASLRIIGAIALIISLPASSNLAMADGTASATDTTHLHNACEVTEKRVSQALKITAGPISKWRCDTYRSDQDFYVLSLHGGSCEPDTICSTLIGYFAFRREDGKVYEWNIAEDRFGDPLNDPQSGDKHHCFPLHGTVAPSAGHPTFRVSSEAGAGLIALVERDRKGALIDPLPANVRSLFPNDETALYTSITGDFVICPIEAPRPGRLRLAHMKSAENLERRIEDDPARPH